MSLDRFGPGTGGTALEAASQNYGKTFRDSRDERRPVTRIAGGTGFSGNLLHP